MENLYSNIDSSLIPKPSKNIPEINSYVSVMKDDIEQLESFLDLIATLDLVVFKDEPKYYILKGTIPNIVQFKKFWNPSE